MLFQQGINRLLIRKAILIIVVCVVIISALGAAADVDLLYDETCVLCQLRVNTPAIYISPVLIPEPCMSGILNPVLRIIVAQELVAFIAASRSPPLSIHSMPISFN
jgi:hypothetical protein